MDIKLSKGEEKYITGLFSRLQISFRKAQLQRFFGSKFFKMKSREFKKLFSFYFGLSLEIISFLLKAYIRV